MPADFSNLLKLYRLRAGYGLRQFAELIGDASSNYAHRESGARGPWKDMEKLRGVADALGLRDGSKDWYAFFSAALGPGRLAPDIQHVAEKPGVPVLMRTIDELQLTEDELMELVEDLRRRKRK